MENFAATGPAGDYAQAADGRDDRKYATTVFPSLVSRIKALFVDFIFLLVIFAGTSLLINAIGGVPDFIKGSIAIFMLCLYDPLLTSVLGGTLGHKAMGLGVRRYNDPERKISFGHAIVRFIVKGFLGWISFLTVTSNKRKRAIHDIASGSMMLNVR